MSAKLGNKDVRIKADIIPADIPLLFSKASMKKAEMCIDFKTDTLILPNQKIPLPVSKSGHLLLPVCKQAQVLQCEEVHIKITLT